MYIEYIEEVIEEADRAIDNMDYKTAESLLCNVLYDEPAYAKVHNNLGWLYLFYLNKRNKSEIHLKYALKFDPEMEAAYLNIGELYLLSKEFDKLIIIMKEALNKKSANRFMAYLNLGKAYELKGEYSLAIKNYKKALMATIDSYYTENIKKDIKRCKFKKYKLIF